MADIPHPIVKRVFREFFAQPPVCFYCDKIQGPGWSIKIYGHEDHTLAFQKAVIAALVDANYRATVVYRGGGPARFHIFPAKSIG